MHALTRPIRAIVSLWVIVTIVFMALRLTGDPVLAVIDPDNMTKEMIDSLRQQWGFDGTITEQYIAFLSNLTDLNFGRSTMNGLDAFGVVMESLPYTVSLAAFSFLVMVLVGVPAGIYSALRVGSRIDTFLLTLTTMGFAIPNFFLGLLLIIVFAVILGWLPSGGTGTWQNYIMPVMTIGITKAAIFTRFVRSSVIDANLLPCITAARARGLSSSQIVLRHILPNAILPLVTILPLLVGSMISAASIVEAVFAWPGVGRLIVNSVAQRDLAVVQVIVMLVALTMITLNYIVDTLYGWLDPRVVVSK